MRWSSEQARWTVEMESGPSRERTSCTCFVSLHVHCVTTTMIRATCRSFLAPTASRGRIVASATMGQRIWTTTASKWSIIGSGATAVTLVPSMAKTAAHVTMLQRSPSYIFARPGTDPLVVGLKRYLPEKVTSRLARWKNILLGMYFYRLLHAPNLKKSVPC